MSPIVQDTQDAVRAAAVVTALVLSLLIGAVDALAGPEIHFSVLYLVPVLLAGWFAGLGWGLAVAGVCGVVWLGADAAGGAVYSREWIPIWNMGVLLGFLLLFAAGVSYLRRLLDEETRLAREDLLTNIPNLRGFHEKMPEELKEAAGRGTPVTMGLVELHDLAYINERFGVQAGDLLIRVTARTLRESLRRQDLLCRVGGSTFAMILPGTGTDGATRVLDAAREKVLDQMRIYDRPLSIAIAAVTADRPPAAGEVLLEKTGTLLRTIKQDRSPHPFRVIAFEEVAA